MPSSDTTLGHLVGKSDSTITKLSVSSAEIQKLLSSAKATIACFKNVFKEMHQRTIDRLAGSIMPLVLFKEAYAMKLRDVGYNCASSFPWRTDRLLI